MSPGSSDGVSAGRLETGEPLPEAEPLPPRKRARSPRDAAESNTPLNTPGGQAPSRRSSPRSDSISESEDPNFSQDISPRSRARLKGDAIDFSSESSTTSGSEDDAWDDHIEARSSCLTPAIETAFEDEIASLFDAPNDDDAVRFVQDGIDSDCESDRDCREDDDTDFPARVRAQKEGLAGWTYDTGFSPVRIGIDDVELDLEARYLHECSAILRNVRREVAGSDADKTLSRLDILRAFLPSEIMERIANAANKGLRIRGKEQTSAKELLKLVVLHALCAVYGESPRTVCSQRESRCFLQLNVSASRYYEVWSSLSGTEKTRERVSHDVENCDWTVRPRAASLILQIESDVAAINRHLIYVPGATILSLDDDHLRLSSRAVSQLAGLRVVNNPAKALGPVGNALCSALTSSLIVCHFSRPSESVEDVWTRVIQEWQGAPTSSSLLPMSDAVFAADRGYNTKRTIELLQRLGATGLGTHKRTPSFPFSFGEGAVARKHKGVRIPEVGSRAVYSARISSTQRSSQRVEAIVYRESYSGRVAALWQIACACFQPKSIRLSHKTHSEELSLENALRSECNNFELYMTHALIPQVQIRIL